MLILQAWKIPEMLQIAAEAERILVSQDRRTMPAHFARFVADHQSPGVILLREAIPISTRNRRAHSDLERE